MKNIHELLRDQLYFLLCSAVVSLKECFGMQKCMTQTIFRFNESIDDAHFDKLLEL